ncbi:hypothetical protein [Nostoc sp. CHAB 5715]|nr:hypothetical protein [Nostoc sp. CHAB 5715]MCC5622434.1 hypothetical protein [Nostoc sp. CHAB 5715]
MPYRIAFSRNSLSHLQVFTAREQRIITTAITEQLSFGPTMPTGLSTQK